MQKKHLLLILLMALFAPLAMNAQSRSTLTVYGDNTTTNEYVPIYGYYCDEKSKCEFIIPAEKLSAMNGGIVSDMKFYLSSSNSSNDISATFNVFVKEVSTTTLTGFTGTTNATSVYTSTISIPKNQSNFVLDIPFSSNYIYGGGNLLIGVYQTGSSSYNHTYWTGEDQSGNTAWQGYGSGSGNGRKFLPKTTFTYEISTTPSIILPATATVWTGFTTTLTATTMNVTGTPSITYTSSNTSVATVTGSGTTATVTGESAGTATITATMTVNGTPYTAQCAITVEDPSYCTPGTGDYDNNGISNVTFGTGPIVNNTVGGINYGDYSNLVGAVSAGATCQVDITYETGYTYGTIIWVDWNQNYTFEGNEAVYAGTSGSDNPTTLNATFTVPAATSAGDYRMRIIGSDSGLDSYTGSLSAAANADPCGTYNWSTCHDYTLRVSSDPSISLNPTSATVITGFTQTLTASYANVTGTPTITYSTSDASVASVIGSGTTATVTAVAPGTATITATMAYGGTNYTAQCAITVENPSYCTPSFGSNSDCITNITLGDINNTTASSSTNGYGDYTSMSTELEPGTTATLSLTSGSGTGTHAAAVWIDFNDNYVFESSERVGTQGNISGDATVSINLSIPSDAAVGSHRLRVVYQYSVEATAIDPCASASYGEGEDYTVNIATVACPTPTITNITPGLNTAVISTDSDAENFNVQYRVVSASATPIIYDFEDGTFSGWTYYDNDGDDQSWIVTDALGSYTSGETYVASHGGAYYLRSTYNSNALVENWLISPQFKLGGSISFYIERLNGYDDYYKVYVSTTGTSISDFTVEVQGEREPAASYELVTIDLSNYSGDGYVAIKHYAKANDQAYLFLDDVTIIEGVENPWQTANDLTLTGLNPETTYQVQVQADCGSEDGVSSWSAIATFTTPDACAVPTGLTAEVTGNAAELSWTGVQENYNVQYREVDPTVPATIILNVPNDIWNDGSGYQMLLDADATAFDNLESDGISDYSIFEYLIPTNATYDPNTTGFVINTSVTIQIPAGTYDWFITNPSPDYNNVYIAASNGNVGGRQDNYVFEPGVTYEFTPSLFGSNDGIDVTITDNGNAWTLIEGVTNPYTLENLSAQTTYKYQVQGVDCDNWSASATFTTGEFYTKAITGYGDDETVKTGWYLIATPLEGNNGETAASSVTNMIKDGGNGYDLYRFDQNPTPDANNEVLEWRNFKANPFNLKSGEGYLYANKENVTLVFTGAAYSGNGEVPLTYSTGNPDANMHGWNLVGNPFAVDAYITKPFFTMDGGSTYESQAAGTAIAPMQGILVYTETNNETLTFSTTNNPGSKGSSLNLNLTQGRGGLIDRAIVSFNDSQALPKLQFRDNSTSICITVDGKDYAVVGAENQGEMPVSFKAEENGTYNLSFNSENVSFGYLHLVDNMTGADIDLLANPSYTFEAKKTDYRSRFKLVFATGNADDDFAFCSNGNWVINNDGNATLQVIDVNGRIIRSESINGCANVNLNVANGVYMIRLINGSNVKTQKVVVR